MVGRLAGLAGGAAGCAAVAVVEELSVGAGDGLEGQLLADSEVVHIIATWAGAATNGGVEDGVEGTGGAGTLEGELVDSAGEHADAA